jgi:hypothetical protein
MKRVVAVLCVMSCGNDAVPKPQQPHPPVPSSGATFDEEVLFLKAHGANVEIVAAGTGHIAIAPDYQMRVMTSEVEPHGRSLGFVHHAFIEAGKTGTQFDNYGGEDRFWLGPEAGPWGLYFPPGSPYTFSAWQTPHELQEGKLKSVTVTNHIGTKLEVDVDRHIVPVREPPFAIGREVKWVGFTSQNVIMNRGSSAWTPQAGEISIWILGMYNPAPDTKIIFRSTRPRRVPS